MKSSIEKQSLVGFGLASIVMVLINALSYWSLVQYRETAYWVAHTHEVEQKIKTTLAELTEAETGQRGYLLTGDDNYLKLYKDGADLIHQHIGELQTLTADNPNQQRRINTLKPLVTQRLAGLEQVIQLRKHKGFSAALTGVKTNQGTKTMARIRQLLDEMVREEAALLKQRLMRYEAASRTQNFVFSAGIVFNVIVFYWLYRAISREIQRRLQAQATVQKVNEQLEQKVAERTAALKDKIIALEQTKAALKENYNLLRSVIDASPHPIFVKDLQGRYQLMNISGASRFNKQPEEVIGLNSSSLFPPEVCAKFQADEQRVLTTGQAETVEETVPIGDKLRTYHTTTNVYRDSEGNLLGIVGFARDITPLKQAQEELRQANQELEMRVQERTRELVSREHELVRSNTELEQFAYVASHDLREPLRKIKSYTELLAENYQHQLDEKADKYINYITDGASRMQALISDLLTYSRVGKGELTVEPTHLESILERIINDLSLTIKENDALVTVKPLPTILANPQQMAQLFQNLIVNAIKYRGEATPRILIQSELKDNQWLISIQDNGIGIKPLHFERIFAIFQRLHSRDQYSGTGIGLAICKKIVERHGGRIWVESEFGTGTTFYFTLPK
jgi:PAS domain S-box-containing protein